MTIINRLAHLSLNHMGFADSLGLRHEETGVRFVLEATPWDTTSAAASAEQSDLTTGAARRFSVKPVADCWFCVAAVLHGDAGVGGR